MRASKHIWERLADNKPLTVVSAVCSILGFPLGLLSIAGVQMPWILDTLGNSSFIWLPILTLITGFLAGWNARKQKMAEDGLTADRIANLEGEISYLNDKIYELEHPFMGVNERLRRSGMGGFGDIR